jgi:hypothetical protein
LSINAVDLLYIDKIPKLRSNIETNQLNGLKTQVGLEFIEKGYFVARAKIFLALFAISGAILLAFNNCSEVAFEKGEVAASGSPQSPAGDSGGGGLTPDEIQDIIDTLPPEEIDTPRPISDLENDPTLYDRYKCPDSDGVIICHFPENVEAQVTQCVGRPAVSTHYDHIRNYVKDSLNKTIGDYLGPCRVAL